MTQHTLARHRTVLWAILTTFSLQLSTTQAQELLVPLQQAARTPLSPKEQHEVKMPFFDDFSDYEGTPNPQLWATQDAFINRDYAPLPPTLGMATLDVLDAHGALHATASTAPFGADTLCSLPLRLDSIFTPTRRHTTPADSLRLSFYYLPGGGTGPLWERVGEAPDEEDSLILEFYDPEADSWQIVWATPGICVDSLLARTGMAWQQVSVAVNNPRYLVRGFRFRFRNLASLETNPKAGLAGNTDQWNLDYIYLDHGRSSNERTYRDVAFVEKAPSMLAHYQAMPWRQFSEEDMADHIDIVITNLYSQPLTTQYQYTLYSPTGNRLDHYDGGHENAPAFLPNGTYQTAAAHAHPQVTFAYNPTGPTTYSVEHVLVEGVSGDNRKQNDTMRFEQVFSDYYAYDDGVPENGYGISVAGHIACLFPLRVEDTLTAIDLYFNHTRNGENLAARFYLAVWRCQDGHPSTLLYYDPVKRQPIAGELNRYHRYILNEPVLLSDSVFIGLIQQGGTYLNLGFDRSNDLRDRTFYKTSNAWQQSVLSGALMLRPCFGTSALVDIPPITPPVDGPTEYYDLLGRRIPQPHRPGIYLKRTGNHTQKIIITP